MSLAFADLFFKHVSLWVILTFQNSFIREFQNEKAVKRLI